MKLSHELFPENNNEKDKTQLNDYLNMNVIELSKVIILNYGYGINIIWQKWNISVHFSTSIGCMDHNT